MEAFSIKKLLTSPFTGLYWVKCMMMGLGIGMLIFVGYGMYKAFIKITPTTHQDAERIDNYYNNPKATFGCAHVWTYPENGTRD